eukprot:scaffold1108_cov260-Pinguiococcus_pyrenoidosus.AAC.6
MRRSLHRTAVCLLSTARTRALSDEALCFSAPGPYVVPVVSPAAARSSYPVRRIFCVGRNYADHAQEMQKMDARVTREIAAASEPFFFAKHPECLAVCAAKDAPLEFPPMTNDLHHEVELVVALGPSLGEGRSNLSIEEAHEHIFGYAVGVDLTRRDLQAAAKASRKPWHCGKDFDGAAVIGEMVTADMVDAATASDETEKQATSRVLLLQLRVNGELRQSGPTSAMIHSVPQLIASLSRYQRVKPGDLIYTGTPAGVSRLQIGDRVSASAELHAQNGEAKKQVLSTCSFALR